MFQLLGRLFGKDQGSSKEAAKDRLRLVLVHDRTELSSNEMESLKEELLGVISKYFEIQEEAIEVNFDREERSMALVANVPIRQMRRNAEANANS